MGKPRVVEVITYLGLSDMSCYGEIVNDFTIPVFHLYSYRLRLENVLSPEGY